MIALWVVFVLTLVAGWRQWRAGVLDPKSNGRARDARNGRR